MAVQQAFPVPRRRMQARPRPDPGAPTPRIHEHRLASLEESVPSASPSDRGASVNPHRQGCEEWNVRRARPPPGWSAVTPHVASMRPGPRVRAEENSGVGLGKPLVERVLHSSPSHLCLEPQTLHRTRRSGPQYPMTPPNSPLDHANNAYGARRMPQESAATSLDASGVEKALLDVISQVVASCNAGDHNHLRRLDQFAKSLSSADKAWYPLS